MIDFDALVLGPVMGIFGEDLAHGLPVYTPAGHAAFDLADAVFDDAYSALMLQDGAPETNTLEPVLGVRLALFPVPPAQNDEVYIPRVGITFIVRDVQPDGHGHAKLILMQRAAP
jgi:hypothetical protein